MLVEGGNQCSVLLYPLPPQTQTYVINYKLIHPKKYRDIMTAGMAPRNVSITAQHTVLFWINTP
jgi:hypothetical protein